MSDPAQATSSDPEVDPRTDGARIEQLLRELPGIAGPETWPRIDELVQRLVRLYGTGLMRLLGHARATVGPDDLQARICADELVASLLLVHGAHPESAEQRARRTIERLQPHLGQHAIEVSAVDRNGLTLRLRTPCDGCGTSHLAIEQALREALSETAPELGRIEIEGLAPDQRRSSLVTLHVPRSGVGAS